MLRSIVAFVACSGLALAQNNTLQFFWPHAGDYQDPAVTVQSANASATVFHIACPTPSNPDNCDWHQGVDYTIFNGSTYEATMTGDSYTLTRTCEDKGQNGVNCYMEGYDESITAPFAANEYWAGETTDTITATVTSGGEKLKAAATGAASSSSPSPAAGSHTNAPATASTAHLPQATNAADKHRTNHAALSVFLCIVAAAFYI